MLGLFTLAACSADPAANGALDSSSGGDASDASPSGPTPTWNEQVAPIVFAKCASCHREGGIAPFSLLTYEGAVPFARAMSREVVARTMPPTVIDASGACNAYRGDVAWLSDGEIETIRRWAAEGTPVGDPARRPSPPSPPQGLDGVDTRFDIGTSYTPPAEPADQYRCFLADPGLAADRFITGYEVLPGDARVVHHVIVYSLPTAESEAAATRADAADPMPGYTCFGGPGVTGSAPLALWAPGGDAVRFPDGTGLRINGGRKVIIQVHYNLLHGSFPDRTAVRLRTAATAGAEARLVPVAATDINIPPRASMTVVNGDRSVPVAQAPRGLRIYGTAPHMHGLGRTQRLTVRSAGDRCLASVDQWNFHWQRLFFYATPIEIDPGATIRVSCGYDSTSRTVATRRGEGTEDEMCLNYLYVTSR